MEPAADVPPPPPSSSLDASRVADYLLSRRHLAAAFELYQDYLAHPPPPPSASSRANAPADDGDDDDDGNSNDDDDADAAVVVKKENDDAENEARDALEAYFANPRRFPLADLQRYANAVDSE